MMRFQFQFICILLIVLAFTQIEAKKAKKTAKKSNATTTLSPIDSSGSAEDSLNGTKKGNNGRGHGGGHNHQRHSHGGHGSMGTNHALRGVQGGNKGWNPKTDGHPMVNMNNPGWNDDGIHPAFQQSPPLPFNVPQFIEDATPETKTALLQTWLNRSLTTSEKLDELYQIAANVSDDFNTEFKAFVQEVQQNFTNHQNNITATLQEIQKAVPEILSLQASQTLTSDEMMNQTNEIINSLKSFQSKIIVRMLTCRGHSGGIHPMPITGGTAGNTGWAHSGPSIMQAHVAPAPISFNHGASGGMDVSNGVAHNNVIFPPFQPGEIQSGGPMQPAIIQPSDIQTA